MKSDLRKLIDDELSKYPKREIPIAQKKYDLYVVPEFCDEDLNVFEGFLIAEAKSKSEVLHLKSRYRPPVSGYVPRIAIVFYDDHLLIKDYRDSNKPIITKTINKLQKAFLTKLKRALADPKKENLDKLFDRSDVIEEFYILFKKAREFILQNLSGISGEEKREEFVDNFMMQMLTLWYLQERGFFNEDKRYFITKFTELKQKDFFNRFKSYYEFLIYLFDKISDNLDSQYHSEPILGKVVVVGPAVFINGYNSKAISIADRCFYKEGMTEYLINTPAKKVTRDVPLLNLFESRDWTEGNIDEFVLGAIYEKLITYMERKKLGAYYTPEAITCYICKNTIEPYLVDKVNEYFGKQFKNIDHIIESNDKDILLYLFEQLKEIKILDPAVGSAHFLESAINVLVEIYAKIWQKAKDLGIKEGLNITIANEKGNIEEKSLLEVDEETFQLYVKFFIILSRNVYGVDINPSAIKIAKARLFLTLAKHFRAGSERDIFIRFPNVHFNLREGNSLIGYTKFEEAKLEQAKLDLFIRDEQAVYVAEKIRVVTDLKPYLQKVAPALKIDGNLLSEVEELNEILLKRKINKQDFERILRTKEKLIRILIASLNSRYAIPLNDLLTNITNLFNQKLDEKFAEEYSVQVNELKKIKTFHWIFEFPEVFAVRKGFDVIIGNPPYGNVLTPTEKRITSAIHADYNEVAADFIDLSIRLLRYAGRLGMVTTIAIMKNSRLGSLHRKLEKNLKDVKIASFARRPTKIFENAEINVALIIAAKGHNGDIQTSDFIRFKERLDLNNIEYSPISGLVLRDTTDYGDAEVLPAVGPEIKRSILVKLLCKKRTIRDCLGPKYPLYFRRTANYWMNVSIEYLRRSKNMVKIMFT